MLGDTLFQYVKFIKSWNEIQQKIGKITLRYPKPKKPTVPMQ